MRMAARTSIHKVRRASSSKAQYGNSRYVNVEIYVRRLTTRSVFLDVVRSRSKYNRKYDGYGQRNVGLGNRRNRGYLLGREKDIPDVR